MSKVPMTGLDETIEEIYGPAEPGTCMHVSTSAGVCGEPATQHVVWTRDSGSPMCRDHAEESENSECLAIHPYNAAVCSHPDAEFDININQCVMPTR